MFPSKKRAAATPSCSSVSAGLYGISILLPCMPCQPQVTARDKRTVMRVGVPAGWHAYAMHCMLRSGKALSGGLGPVGGVAVHGTRPVPDTLAGSHGFVAAATSWPRVPHACVVNGVQHMWAPTAEKSPCVPTPRLYRCRCVKIPLEPTA